MEEQEKEEERVKENDRPIEPTCESTTTYVMMHHRHYHHHYVHDCSCLCAHLSICMCVVCFNGEVPLSVIIHQSYVEKPNIYINTLLFK